MKKLQAYKYGMLVLVCLNLILITLLLLDVKSVDNNRPQKQGDRERAVHMLDLDEEQMASFHEFVKEHIDNMEMIGHRQEEFLRLYFSTLGESRNTEEATSLLDSITLLDTKKITLTYDHFNDVKAMLNEDQLLYFDKFVQQAMNNIFQDKPKPPPPKRH